MADLQQQRRQVLAVDVFHRQERLVVRFRQIIHTANVRMRHLPGDTYLIVEAGEPVRVTRQLGWQKLKRHRLAELQVVGPVALAHRALAKRGDDGIALAQEWAGLEALAARGGPGGRWV